MCPAGSMGVMGTSTHESPLGGAPGNTWMGSSPQAAGGFLLAQRTGVSRTGRCMLMCWTIVVQQCGDLCGGV